MRNKRLMIQLRLGCQRFTDHIDVQLMNSVTTPRVVLVVQLGPPAPLPAPLLLIAPQPTL